MSTKQKVVFAFMVVFLGTSLVALGLWLHFHLEYNLKKATLDALEAQRTRQKFDLDKLRPVMTEPNTGLSDRLKAETARAEGKIRDIKNPEMSPIKLYEDKGKDLQQKWGSETGGAFQEGDAGKAWKTVYDEWKKQNAEIAEARERLKTQDKTSQQQVEQSEAELKTQLDDEERVKRENILKRKQWDDELAQARYESEDAQDKIGHVTRELEKKPEAEKDGVVLYAAPQLNLVTVDIGYEQGGKLGLKFDVFSGRHNIPVKKGKIQLTDVHATSSDAIILADVGVQMYDPSTGWVAPDPKMRYSVYSSAGADGTEPQRLEKLRSKREIIQDMRAEKIRQEQIAAGVEEPPNATLSPTPPLGTGKGFEPIVAGDWISNTEFSRIIPDRAFRKDVVNEIVAMRDVSLGALTFYIADNIRPFRREFLKRLCERNRCRTAGQISAEVDYMVTSPDTTRLEVMKERLRDVPEEKRQNLAELPPETAARVRIYNALLEAKKFGIRAISEDELEKLFGDRQRKGELLTGMAIQPGQSTFYVVGETRLRSVRETGLWIQEHGGVLAPRLDANVDYLVVGAGLSEAKLDKTTGRVFYVGQDAPATAIPFYDAVKQMGLKVLREEELPAFFGRKGS